MFVDLVVGWLVCLFVYYMNCIILQLPIKIKSKKMKNKSIVLLAIHAFNNIFIFFINNSAFEF